MTEQLSALMDSELTEAEAVRLVSALKHDAQLSRTWDTYHLLGDALRKSPQLSADFGAKMAQRLAGEPTVLAPHRKPKRTMPHFALPIAASVAAVSLVGILTWQMTRVNQVGQAAALVALAQPSAAKSTAPARVRFSNTASNPYLLAHQEFSPSYAMEGIPAYVRTVSEQQEGGQ